VNVHCREANSASHKKSVSYHLHGKKATSQSEKITQRELPYGAATSIDFNPLGPNYDQHQIFPHNINTKSRGNIKRIYKMTTKGNGFDLLTNSPN